MNKTVIKSIWAILAGFIFIAIISTATDLLLTKAGLMKQPFNSNPAGFILFVIFYRSLFGTIGSWFTASLSPAKPMMHSMIGGTIGFVIATIGAIVMWNKPPHWYPIGIIITTLPCAWIGAQIFLKRTPGWKKKMI